MFLDGRVFIEFFLENKLFFLRVECLQRTFLLGWQIPEYPSLNSLAQSILGIRGEFQNRNSKSPGFGNSIHLEDHSFPQVSSIISTTNYLDI